MHYQPLFNMFSGQESAKFKKSCKFIIFFFKIILPFAHLQYVGIILTKFSKDTLKTLGRVDFTIHALLAILQTPYI